MTNEQIFELVEKIVIPVITAVLGFLGGMHVEKRKFISKIKNNNSSVTGNSNVVNQGNIINK